MKTLKYIAIILGSISLFTSCDSMEDSYKDYLQGGEIVYRAKAKEVVGYSGYNRAKLTWKLDFPTHVVKCQIREGDVVLAEIPVEYQDHLDLGYTLTNQEEKTHTYSVYSLDIEGNTSIKSDVIVDVYGDSYISTLRTGRSVQAVLRPADDKTKALVRLSTNASSKVVGTKIIYKSTSGEKTEQIDATVNEVLLNDVAEDSYFNLVDVWKPADTAIDEFPASVRKCAFEDIPTDPARSLLPMTYRTPDDASTVKATFSTVDAAEGVTKTIVRYEGSGDEGVTVLASETTKTLENIPASGLIKLETIVEVGGIEYATPTITMEAGEIMTKIGMSGWEVVSYSSQQQSGETGGHAEHAIDDNLDTYWHTEYSPNQPGYPHWMIINLNETVTIKKVAVARRSGNDKIATKMRIEVSSDGENWTTAGEFAPNTGINSLQLFTLANELTGSYVRVTGLTGAAHYMCLAEINLFK